MSVRLPQVWRDYRTRRRLLIGTLSFIPVVPATRAALAAMNDGGSLRQLLLALWATAVVAAVVWFAEFRCPYCARPFHWTWLVANPLSGACLHCGFEKWRDPHAAREYGRR